MQICFIFIAEIVILIWVFTFVINLRSFMDSYLSAWSSWSAL